MPNEMVLAKIGQPAPAWALWERSGLNEMLPIVFHLFDRLVNVSQSRVLAVLDHAFGDFRLPTLAKLLERADIQIAIVKVIFEFGHVTGHETTILADGVTAHG